MVLETRPEVAPVGTVVVRDVGEATVTMERVPLNSTLLAEVALSKLLPEIVTVVPAEPIVGVKLLMTGASEPTVKGVLLFTVPAEVVTEIGPVVAPAGTLVRICVAVDEVTVATVPLNLTVFSLGVWLKAVP